MKSCFSAAAIDDLCSNIGYILHSSILKKLQRDARIADIGTGTGIFLHDLASKLPRWKQLDGFDISAKQFPPEHARTPGISFHIVDAKQPFPKHLHSTYDLVCLRLMVAAMEKDDWKLVTRNMIELLKPGGAIQWVEGDHSTMFLEPLKSSPRSRRDRMQRWGTKIVNGVMGERLKHGWSDLPNIFRDQGLEGVIHEVFDSDRVSGPTETTDVQIAVCRSIASVPRRLESFGGQAGVDAMIKEMKEDAATGAFIRWQMHVAIGFKPAEFGLQV